MKANGASMVGKSGQIGKVIAGKFNHLEGNLTFIIKKYIRNSGKSDYLGGKNTLFQALGASKLY